MNHALAAWIVAAGLASGCDRSADGVHVQSVPKQPPPSTQAAPNANQLAAGVSDAAAGAPALSYTLPAEWVREPNKNMRLASFLIGQPPAQAEMIISKFPADSGSTLENLNRWRGQVNLPLATRDDEVTFTTTTVGGVAGRFYDMTGAQKRLSVAWITRQNEWWFFKLIGPTDIVQQQQLQLQSFLTSVKFTSDDPGDQPQQQSTTR